MSDVEPNVSADHILVCVRPNQLIILQNPIGEEHRKHVRLYQITDRAGETESDQIAIPVSIENIATEHTKGNDKSKPLKERGSTFHLRR